MWAMPRRSESCEWSFYDYERDIWYCRHPDRESKFCDEIPAGREKECPLRRG